MVKQGRLSVRNKIRSLEHVKRVTEKRTGVLCISQWSPRHLSPHVKGNRLMDHFLVSLLETCDNQRNDCVCLQTLAHN